jgi:sulfur transfer protein SufE/stress-induced morphogen
MFTALSQSSNSDTELLANLTPQLRKMTQAFASIPDEKTRYKQLLYMANQLPPLDPSKFIPENKVPGCLSTVYVDCESSIEETSSGDPPRTVIKFVGDSDGLLTKGLVAFLVKGLSGYTAEEIERVDPEFIRISKISQSLTPGRNNGFLNMIAVMKRKARELSEHSTKTEDPSDEKVVENEAVVTTFEEREGKPMYNTIMHTLITKLKPSRIELVDNSDQHAGHVGSRGWEESGESHFALLVVSDAFEGLSLVKRHQLIYLLLGDVMSKIHALQIMAMTRKEVEQRSPI